MCESSDFADKKNTAPKPLYTNAGKSSRKNGTAKAFQGWTMEGYQRFDELYNGVKADCMTEERDYYKETLKALVAQNNAKERPSRLAEESGDGEAIYPAHDFDDVVTGGLNLLAHSAHDAENSEEEEEEEHSNSECDNKEGHVDQDDLVFQEDIYTPKKGLKYPSENKNKTVENQIEKLTSSLYSRNLDFQACCNFCTVLYMIKR
jgi:hypothetical protein